MERDGFGDRRGSADTDVSAVMDRAGSVEENLVEFFRHFARVRSSGEVREMPGVSIASCGASIHTFNGAFLSEPVAEGAGLLERRILTASVHYAARGLRWAFWAAEHKLPAAIRKKSRAVFQAHGLSLAYENPGMAADRLLPPLRRLPNLDFRRVEKEPERLDFCFVNAAAFRMPFEWCRELYDLEPLWNSRFTGWVGYVDGRPATAAATLAVSGAVGVYCVATLPEEGRKGYAEAVVRHALKKVREEHGFERTILQSSAEGLPLYKQMGYEVVTRFQVYSA
jgi:hypothetical protein